MMYFTLSERRALETEVWNSAHAPSIYHFKIGSCCNKQNTSLKVGQQQIAVQKALGSFVFLESNNGALQRKTTASPC